MAKKLNFSKRLEAARDAFGRRDLKASAQAHGLHQIAQVTAQERHGGVSSQYLGDMVYGGLDGIVTTFAIVSGVAGAQLSSEIILILISLGLSAAALFGLGAAKVLVTQRNSFRSGLEMLLVGGLAAGVAYGVGALLRGIGG